ncbi:MAG TPA: host attachment protein, partial [Alphaproteobacteria bacterium]|nr:host attachment protein [Alphaproteobacteria bacterium]
LGSRLLGRAFSSVGPARSAMEPPIDARDETRQDFVKELAERLGKAAANESFERLVLAAPPKMLGELKASLSGPVAARLLATLDKDLTHCPHEELLTHLKDVI